MSNVINCSDKFFLREVDNIVSEHIKEMDKDSLELKENLDKNPYFCNSSNDISKVGEFEYGLSYYYIAKYKSIYALLLSLGGNDKLKYVCALHDFIK